MVAFLFAGQGCQYAGMGKDLYDNFPEAKAVFDKAEKLVGFDLKKVCFEGPEEKLKVTSISQPAIVTLSIAAFEAFKARNGLKPAFMAGLSLGEYSALIASGSISFEDGIGLIKIRGELMEEASLKYPGKMAAVLDLPVDTVKEICLSSGAEIANLNSPGQVVITGKSDAVEKAAQLCGQAGAKRVIPLEVSGAFHSSLKSGASLGLKEALDKVEIKDAVVPVVSNYTADVQVGAAGIKDNLIHQIHSSVKWEDSMRFILAKGISSFIEFGPGRVLKGLMRRIEPSARVTNMEKASDILNFSN